MQNLDWYEPWMEQEGSMLDSTRASEMNTRDSTLDATMLTEAADDKKSVKGKKSNKQSKMFEKKITDQTGGKIDLRRHETHVMFDVASKVTNRFFRRNCAFKYTENASTR